VKATPVADVVAHVAEHHGLHVDGRAPGFRDVVELAVGDGARTASWNTAPIAPQSCSLRILRERLHRLFFDDRLVALDQLAPVIGGDVGVELIRRASLNSPEHPRNLVVDAHDHIGIHLDEAAVAVIGKALVAGAGGQGLDRFIVEAEIEHRVHHARHRGARAGAHRQQQRVFRIAEGVFVMDPAAAGK
jgi:hypothetical protein